MNLAIKMGKLKRLWQAGLLGSKKYGSAFNLVLSR